MFKSPAIRVGIFGLILIAMLAGCQFMQRLLSDQKISLPEVSLNRIEVKKDLENSGWWFYADHIQPTKGDKGNRGASLVLAFVFNINNSNKFPVLLNEIKFTAKFQDFKLDEIISSEEMWIPPGKTNELRIFYLFNVQSVRLNLLVQGGQNLLKNKEQKSEKSGKKKENGKDKENGNWLWIKLEEYWTEIQKQETIKPDQDPFVSVADVCANIVAKEIELKVPEKGKECPKPAQSE